MCGLYVHGVCDRLGGIAGNHFNQAYRVTDGVWVQESSDTYASLEALCESVEVGRLCVCGGF